MWRSVRLVILLLLLSCGHAFGCSCAGPLSVCSSYWTTPVVFHGRVIERTLIRPPATEYKTPDGTVGHIQAPGYYRVRLAVSEGFRGVGNAAEMTVQTEEQGSACGYNFQSGKDYLVFAYPDKTGVPQVSHCGMTHELQDTDADLQWIRGLATAPPGATLFGGIGVPPGISRDGTRIVLDRMENGAAVPGTHRELAPDGKGSYRLEGLPAGTYTAALITLPSGTTGGDPRTITLADKSCANLSWSLANDSHIRGHVVDGVGAPVAKLPVALLTRDSRYPNGWGQTGFTVTDESGSYHFDRIAPGDYVVAANQYGSTPQLPYPARYYPQAVKIDEATTLHLGMAQDLSGMDISMPLGMHKVTVPIAVLKPDGSPATLAIFVYGHAVATPYNAQPMTANVDGSGHAMLPLYEGEEYFLTALDSSGAGQRCGGPLRLVAKAGLPFQEIRIEHPWGNCLAQLNPNFKPPR